MAEGNGTSGILINGAKSTTIGGLVAGDANEISGNAFDGIRFTGSGSLGAVVEFNSIGTNANATASLVGNGVYGISVEGPSSVSIGGAIGNAIDFNGTTGNANSKPGATGGVGIKLGTNNPILNNTFLNDTGLGIDLGEDGVTANTPGGPHTGPNDFQNFPVLTKALVSATSTEVIGSLNSTPNTQFTIQFFSSPTANASGFGEGATYLASVLVTTDASGNASFDEILSNVVKKPGRSSRRPPPIRRATPRSSRPTPPPSTPLSNGAEYQPLGQPQPGRGRQHAHLHDHRDQQRSEPGDGCDGQRPHPEHRALCVPARQPPAREPSA